jgi:hypothetical protein
MSPSESASAPTSTAAILSLVFGILGWVGLPVLGSIVAIVCGHMARAEIRNAGVALQGDGLAIAGLVLGWAQLAMTALLVLAMVLFFGGLAAFLVAAGVAGG